MMAVDFSAEDTETLLYILSHLPDPEHDCEYCVAVRAELDRRGGK